MTKKLYKVKGKIHKRKRQKNKVLNWQVCPICGGSGKSEGTICYACLGIGGRTIKNEKT